MIKIWLSSAIISESIGVDKSARAQGPESRLFVKTEI